MHYAEAKFLIPDWGIQYSRIQHRLHSRPARLHWLAGENENPIRESTISISQGLRIWPRDSWTQFPSWSRAYILSTVKSALSINSILLFQVYFPYWNIANGVFGFPKGSKFLKFAIDALFLSFELQPGWVYKNFVEVQKNMIL